MDTMILDKTISISEKLDEIIRRIENIEKSLESGKANSQTKITVIGNRPQPKMNLKGIGANDEFQL